MTDNKLVSQIFVRSSCILGLFLSFTGSIVCAQSHIYEIQTIPLKGDFINFSGVSIAQDRDGFLWFGSSEGLYRYQGTSVKVFRHLQNEDNSLLDNDVYDLLVDSEGILWIGTRNGLNRYDKYTESFIRYQHIPSDTTSLNPGSIWKIVEDRHSNVWIGTSRGFSRFDRATETFKNYQIYSDATFLNNVQPIFSLYPDKEDNLWLFTGAGVYRFHIPSGKTEMMNELINHEDDNITMDMFIDKSGRCWINTFYGLYLYDFQEKTIQQFILRQKNSERIGNQYNRSMLEDSSGNIWIRTFDAIYCYSQELELIYYLVHRHPYPRTIHSQELVKEMFQDNTGSIWFYSPDGIHQFINKRENFRVFSSDSISGERVSCIHVENKNLIWFGTSWGISSLDRGNNTLQMHYGSPWWESGPLYAVNTMCLDRENTLWIGMENMGLVSMVDSGDGTRRFQRHIPESVDSTRLGDYGLQSIVNIFEDKGGRLWIGVVSENFLHYYDRKENKMIRLVDNPAVKNRLPEWAKVRHQTGSDTLWALGSSGVYIILLPFTKISEDQIIPEDVLKCQLVDKRGQRVDLSEWIRVSYMDSSGNIWLGTGKSGLVKIIGKRIPGMETHEYRIKSYNMLHGLPSNDVRSILPDEKGNLWIGTTNGLAKFNIRSETFTNYFIRHGLPSNEFRINSSAVDDDGEMLFGTWGGMVSFYPDSIFTNQNIAPVMITGISINNQILQPGRCDELVNSINFTDKLELPYNKNNLSLEYTILNYYHPELNQYKYKLEGFSDDWIYAGNRANVDFTNLDRGIYTFRVVGSNNDGVWNEEGASLQIIIHPPPWQTWYAYLVYGLLLTGIILRYRRFLINRAKLRTAIEIERMEKEKVQEIDHMKSRFFANISHEFRTPLTLLLGPIEDSLRTRRAKIETERGVYEMMKQNAKRLQRLINQLLDLSKLETGKITLQVSENDMIDFIRTLVLSFLSLAESKKINYEYDLPDSPEKVYYDQDKLEKILTNLISNAFKFTPAKGKVGIKVRFIRSPEQETPNTIEIEVSDTGKGIPQDQIKKIFDRFYQVSDSDTREQEGTGIGLALTKELVDLYRGELSVESVVGIGTTFIVRLPVSKELFNHEEIVVTHEEAGLKPVESRIELTEPEEAGIEVNHELRKSEADSVILIVEDNADLRNYISSNLGSSYQILMAENGKSGLESAIESIPDLVISDVMMPVMDGVEMCRQLKQNERTNHIPVIMLTAKADSQSKMEGLKTGADDYIIKPFNAEELQVRVKNLIQQRQKLREKFMREFIMEPDDRRHVSPQDKLMQEIMDILNHNLDKPDFSINQMSWELHMSRSQLYRKVSALTGLSPTDLLRNIRLRTAASLFNSGQDNVSQVMYQV